MKANIAYIFECMIIYCVWKMVPVFKIGLEKLEKKLFELSKLDKI